MNPYNYYCGYTNDPLTCDSEINTESYLPGISSYNLLNTSTAINDNTIFSFPFRLDSQFGDNYPIEVNNSNLTGYPDTTQNHMYVMLPNEVRINVTVQAGGKNYNLILYYATLNPSSNIIRSTRTGDSYNNGTGLYPIAYYDPATKSSNFPNWYTVLNADVNQELPTLRGYTGQMQGNSYTVEKIDTYYYNNNPASNSVQVLDNLDLYLGDQNNNYTFNYRSNDVGSSTTRWIYMGSIPTDQNYSINDENLLSLLNSNFVDYPGYLGYTSATITNIQ